VRRADARVGRGAMAGGAVDDTAMIDDLLCPGTSTNVPAVRGRALAGLVGAAASPVRRADARVGRGAMAGGAIDGTEMTDDLLCPGTSTNVPVVRGRTRVRFAAVGSPVRRADAFVCRGAIVGGAVDATAMVSARL
jgi:hypothetical protein